MRKNAVKRYKNPNQRLNRYAYLFIAPFVIGFCIFSLYPIIRSIGMSFTNENKPSEFGPTFSFWSNYEYVVTDLQFWHCFVNTIIIFLMNFIPQIICALFFAMLFTSKRMKMHGKKVFQFVYFLPNILTATTVAAVFLILFRYNGIDPETGNPTGGPIYQWFVAMGMDPKFKFFQDPWATRIIIAFIQFWMWFGNSMIVYISGIKAIDKEIFEAAELDGASNSRVFFSITLPILKPIMIYSLITSIIGGLQMFDIPYLITGKEFDAPIFGPDTSPTMTVTIYIYEKMKVYRNRSIASAASVILFLFSLAISIAMYFFVFKEKNLEKKVWKKINGFKDV